MSKKKNLLIKLYNYKNELIELENAKNEFINKERPLLESYLKHLFLAKEAGLLDESEVSSCILYTGSFSISKTFPFEKIFQLASEIDLPKHHQVTSTADAWKEIERLIKKLG